MEKVLEMKWSRVYIGDCINMSPEQCLPNALQVLVGNVVCARAQFGGLDFMRLFAAVCEPSSAL